MDRRLKLNDPGLYRCPAGCGRRALMLLDNVQPLDDHTLACWQDLPYQAAQTALVATDNLYAVTLLDPIHLPTTLSSVPSCSPMKHHD
jgi:hypothetical protein